jgi:hypothetical protein
MSSLSFLRRGATTAARAVAQASSWLGVRVATHSNVMLPRVPVRAFALKPHGGKLVNLIDAKHASVSLHEANECAQQFTD